MTERECYIKLYGWDNYKCVENYDLNRKFIKAFKKNRKLLQQQFGESSQLRLTVDPVYDQEEMKMLEENKIKCKKCNGNGWIGYPFGQAKCSLCGGTGKIIG